MPHIILLGTCDTKLAELLYLRERILTHDRKARVTLLDVGRSVVEDDAITISPAQLLERYGTSSLSKSISMNQLQQMPRGEVLATTSALAVACVRDLLNGVAYSNGEVSGIIGAGGSGNTSVVAAVMQACPIGLPKLLVSTVASGNVAPIVGEADVTLMYSVVDIAGLNTMLRGVLDNAAAAIAGMAAAYSSRIERTRDATGPNVASRKPQVGITMYGVTTPCVNVARQRLEDYGAEVYVFHATGSGGKAMERLVREGALDAVLDVTTTEMPDLLFGGIMSAGPERMRAALEREIPYLVSLGACDMVTFGPRDTVPKQFSDRTLFQHNSMITLMRTNPQESADIGSWIAGRLKEAAAKPSNVEVWIPDGGVSMLDAPGQPFYDTVADRALVDALKAGLQASAITIVSKEHKINDAEFATAMADRLYALMSKG